MLRSIFCSKRLIGCLARQNVLMRNNITTFNVPEFRSILQNLLKATAFMGKDVDVSTYPDYTITKQSELPARRMTDSYCEAILPFRHEPQYREKYTNFLMTIRFGRILEDLDSFAVLISYEHVMQKWPEGRPPFSIVTAMVDQIDVTNYEITTDRDLKFTGNVTWAGSSSLEVTMDVFQEDKQNIFQHVLNAKFLMVARNPKTGKSAVINPLLVETEDEKAIFARGEKAKVARQMESEESLLKVMPTQKETELIHNLFLETIDAKSFTFQLRVKPEATEWMEKAKLKNVVLCHPESRNIYNKIFGGYLMRQGFEVAWANACIYAKSHIQVVSVDKILFQNPVPIGSILFLSSDVAYTHGNNMQIKVLAQRVSHKTGEHVTTNAFNFTFRSSTPIPRIVPKTYAEAMLFLEGKRHYEEIQSHLLSFDQKNKQS